MAETNFWQQIWEKEKPWPTGRPDTSNSLPSNIENDLRARGLITNQGQMYDPHGDNYIGPSNTGKAKVDLASEAAMIGLTYAAVKNPGLALEAIGADSKSFNDQSLYQIDRLRMANALGSVNRKVKGAKRIGQALKTIIENPRQVELAGTGIVGDIGRVSDDFTPSNVFQLKGSGGGFVKNIPFTGTTRGFGDLSGLTGAQRKIKKQNFFEDIYNLGKSEQGLKAVKSSGRYKFGGTGNITGTHRNILKGSPHHFTIDDDLAYAAANTADAPALVKELNKFDIYPGNHPRNFIMAYHDNTKKAWNQTKQQINKLWGNSPNKPTDAQINTFLKMPTEGVTFSRNSKLEDIGQQIAEIHQKGLIKRNWSQILPKGKTVKDIKLSKIVLGIDHQSLIHGIGDNLQSRKDLFKLIESDKWLKLSPKQRAIRVAKVSREQQNVALHVNKIRLDLIKGRMAELNIPAKNWTDIQTWMIQNPSEAAAIGYHKLVSKGTGLTIKELTSDLPKSVAQEVANVFNLEALPRTGELLDKLNKTTKSFKDL